MPSWKWKWVNAFFRRPSMPSMPSTPTKPLRSPVKPQNKTLYSYDARKSLWCPTSEASGTSSDYHPNAPLFSLVSWNVDFAAPLVVRRFQAALSHLEQLLSSTPPPPPTIVLLQEVHSSCFKPLLSNAFIRKFYQVTNISSPHSYSTITLVPHSLASLVSSVSRIPFAETRMQRDCLYFDLAVPMSGGPAPKTLRFRIANTHLESLSGFGDRARPKQLEAISTLLTASGVDGGLVAGDMNSISPSDQNLPEEVGLSDAWLATGAVKNTETGETGDTGEAEGHTWGYQPRCQYPPRRLDKILTVGKLEAVELQRVGVGLKVEGRATMWVSDHYSLFAKISLSS
ncbi:Endonuclease/exonuclease/phosphatase [Mycena rosella]|uniref:Endonuclease/exonuclease/phosphatase n=1 Tax=Mycena rosella TaxID=1033263 RepID=A0AAD7DAD9_MYCRO|nr:Endonuclease/exonuclease/phosphatase [Mycena rosella]